MASNIDFNCTFSESGRQHASPRVLWELFCRSHHRYLLSNCCACSCNSTCLPRATFAGQLQRSEIDEFLDSRAVHSPRRFHSYLSVRLWNKSDPGCCIHLVCIGVLLHGMHVRPETLHHILKTGKEYCRIQTRNCWAVRHGSGTFIWAGYYRE